MEFLSFGPPLNLSIVLASAFPGLSLGRCADLGRNCNFIEDGTIQTVFSVEWLDAMGGVVGTDTVNFRSQLDAVPEPSRVF